MRCPKCGGNKSSVVDSRQAEDGKTIRRRRECDECHHRFTTYERVEERTLVVVKKMAPGNSFLEIKYLMGLFDLLRNVLFQVTKLRKLWVASNKRFEARVKMRSRVSILDHWSWTS